MKDEISSDWFSCNTELTRSDVSYLGYAKIETMIDIINNEGMLLFDCLLYILLLIRVEPCILNYVDPSMTFSAF